MKDKLTYNTKVEDSDYLMTIVEFSDNVDFGGFVDSDGHGYPCKDSFYNRDLQLYPSNFKDKTPSDATHIVWFNR